MTIPSQAARVEYVGGQPIVRQEAAAFNPAVLAALQRAAENKPAGERRVTIMSADGRGEFNVPAPRLYAAMERWLVENPQIIALEVNGRAEPFRLAIDAASEASFALVYAGTTGGAL